MANTIPSPEIVGRLRSCSKVKLTNAKAGRMITYTSGCPKNQKRCWNTTGSDEDSKLRDSSSEKLRLRSRKRTVIPAPRTGKVVNSNTDTTAIAHVKMSFHSAGTPELRARVKLTRKVADPNSELSPSTCRNSMAKLIAEDGLYSPPESGK